MAGAIQDKVFSKMLQTVVPSDYDIQKYAEMSEKGDRRKDKDRPQFSLTLMSGNFRRFNARYVYTPPHPARCWMVGWDI